jgi:hypothetical protein
MTQGSHLQQLALGGLVHRLMVTHGSQKEVVEGDYVLYYVFPPLSRRRVVPIVIDSLEAVH